MSLNFNFEVSTETSSSTELDNRNKTLTKNCNVESNFQIIKLFFCIFSIFGLTLIFCKNLLLSFVLTVAHILKAIFTKEILS